MSRLSKLHRPIFIGLLAITLLLTISTVLYLSFGMDIYDICPGSDIHELPYYYV